VYQLEKEKDKTTNHLMTLVAKTTYLLTSCIFYGYRLRRKKTGAENKRHAPIS